MSLRGGDIDLPSYENQYGNGHSRRFKRSLRR